MPARRVLVKNYSIYEVSEKDYYAWKFEAKASKVTTSKARDSESSEFKDIESLINTWLDWCRTGKLCGRPIGPRTLELYKYYFRLYLKKLDPKDLKNPMTIDLARKVIGSFPPASFSTKLNVYSSLMSFSKYLIENKKLGEEYRTRLKAIRPKRFLPAKKTSLNQNQYSSLIEALQKEKLGGGFGNYDKILTKALIAFISNTGLRNSECCKLKLEDLDLTVGKVFVRLGKGNKNRTVGINQETLAVLSEYLEARNKFDSDYVFVNKLGNQFTVEALAKKVHKVTTRLGYKDISPHSLRRTFATINSAKGKPLNHLRIALGHADLSTTQSYIMTT
jgi:site-specific recombinase XerD